VIVAPRSDRERASIAVLDANVLYSQVLSDYFVHAQSQNLINLRWSSRIIDEVVRNKKKRAGERFTSPSELTPRLAAADALGAYIKHTYPESFVEPTDRDYRPFTGLPMPDPDDRHVVATAVAAGATYLCTSNTVDFPTDVMKFLEIRRVTPDALLHELVAKHPLAMARAHQQLIAWTPRATHRTTLDALARSQSPMFRQRMERLLGSLGNLDSRDDLAQVYASAIAERDRARTGLLPPSTQPPNAAQVSTRRLMGHRGRQPLDQQRGAGG